MLTFAAVQNTSFDKFTTPYIQLRALNLTVENSTVKNLIARFHYNDYEMFIIYQLCNYIKSHFTKVNL